MRARAEIPATPSSISAPVPRGALSRSAASTTAIATVIVRVRAAGPAASRCRADDVTHQPVAAVEPDAAVVGACHAGSEDDPRTRRACVAVEGCREPVHAAAEARDLRPGGARGAQPLHRRRQRPGLAERRRAVRAMRSRARAHREWSSRRRARPARRAAAAPPPPCGAARARRGCGTTRDAAAAARRPAGRARRRARRSRARRPGPAGSAGMPSTLAAGSGCGRPRRPISQAGDSSGRTMSSAEPQFGRQRLDRSRRAWRRTPPPRRCRLPSMRIDASCPPTRSDASTTVTGMPARARSRATTRPATPAPITMT